MTTHYLFNFVFPRSQTVPYFREVLPILPILRRTKKNMLFSFDLSFFQKEHEFRTGQGATRTTEKGFQLVEKVTARVRGIVRKQINFAT